MAKTTLKKPRKPQDLTNYSLRGLYRRLTDLEVRVAALETPAVLPCPWQQGPLEPPAQPASGEGGDDLGLETP